MAKPASKNSLVSIRIPETLLKDLQNLAQKNHFLDVSEQVRSIVRNKWQEAQDPYAYQIKKLRNEISTALNKGTEVKSQERLLKELEKIRDSIRGDGRE